MNRAELRRLLLVALPPTAAVLLALALVATLLHVDTVTTSAPRIGEDHWHAVYQIWVCGERQPDIPKWESGIHTHADGVIHIHPFSPSEEGRGARLIKWFEYGGGVLTLDQMRIPGSRGTFRNGDVCPDGSTGTLHVSVNGEPLDDWMEYIPQDGDRIAIVFGTDDGPSVSH